MIKMDHLQDKFELIEVKPQRDSLIIETNFCHKLKFFNNL